MIVGLLLGLFPARLGRAEFIGNPPAANAWSQIEYTLCCNRKYMINFGGSAVPAHSGYIEDELVWERLMTKADAAKFIASGGPSHLLAPPGSRSGPITGTAP